MQSLKNIWTLILKEWRSLFSDGVMGGLLVIVFTVLVYQAANGIRTDVKNATVGVLDLDQSTLSHRITDALPSPWFARAQAVSREEIDAKMNKGEYVFVLEFPQNFQHDVLAGRAPEVQLLIDATTTTQAGMGQNYITQIFNREITQFLGQQGLRDQITPVKNNVNIVFNPNSESAWFLGVMQINNMMTLLGLVLVGATIIREREHSTIEHMLVTPVTAAQIVWAKIIANGLVVCLAAILSIKIMVMGIIGSELSGALMLYFFGTLMFMFSISALAVMLATFAPTLPQYSLLIMPFYVVTLMFSGANSPRKNMPQVAQNISEYWTTTQFTTFTQNVLFRGANLAMTYPQLMTMAISGAIFMTLAIFRFKTMLEKQN